MAAIKSMWKGHLQFSLITVPIKVYKATDDPNKFKFNQIHEGCGGRVGRENKCKACGKPADNGEILKGYEHTTDEYVTFTKDEIASVKVKSSKTIEIQGFVKASKIGHLYVNEPYYIGPDGKVAEQTYLLLARALGKQKVVAIGKIVFRDREDTVAIAPVTPLGHGLIAYKLRHVEDIRDFGNVGGDLKPNVDKEQLKMATMLIDKMMKTELSEFDMSDSYRETLEKMVDDKVEGREIVVVKDDKVSTPSVDILDALKSSMEKANKIEQIAKAKAKAAK